MVEEFTYISMLLDVFAPGFASAMGGCETRFPCFEFGTKFLSLSGELD